MADADLDREIRQRIDRFLEELTTLVKRSALDSVRSALGDGSTRGVRRGPGRPRKVAGATARRAPATRRRRGAKRSSVEVDAQMRRLQGFIGSNPGLRLEELGQQLGQPTKDLRGPLTKLMDQGAVRSEGQSRGTRYFPARGGGTAGTRKATRKGRKKSAKKKKKTTTRKATAA